jgi:hypothetical protein
MYNGVKNLIGALALAVFGGPYLRHNRIKTGNISGNKLPLQTG